MGLSQDVIEALFQPTESDTAWNNRCVTMLGRKGVGKTTLLSGLPGMLLIETDYRGGDLVTGCEKQKCLRWDYAPVKRKTETQEKFERRMRKEIKNGNIGFLQIVEGLLARPANKRIIGIDTVTGLYNSMVNDFCTSQGILSLPDDYGRTQSMLNRVFSDTFKSLMAHGYGIIFTAHIKEDKFMTKTETTSRVMPNTPKPVWDVIAPASDIIFYFKIEERKDKNGKRIPVRILSSELMEEYFDSGGRFEVEPFEATPQNYVNELTAAISRKLGTDTENSNTKGQADGRSQGTTDGSTGSGSTKTQTEAA